MIVNLEREALPADAYVFKHSTRCPTSAAAAARVRAARLDLPVYWIDVIERRVLSDWVESHLGVQHESPQLIEIRGGKVTRVLNHHAITAKALGSPQDP
jgi:bacillithiol system protein YtxJ